jgi:predicted RNA-binding Zn ribbon-like protein
VAHTWTAGRLCLDFANSPKLSTYRDLAAWAGWAGAVPPPLARALARAGGRRPAAASDALGRAEALRSAISAVMASVAERRPPPARALDDLNGALAQTLGRTRIVRRGPGFGWEWKAGDEALDRLLWPLVRSASEVLTSTDVAAVRVCARPGCGRLFLDASRNGSRRWCDMAVCGNRAKVQRHYARRRSRRTRSAGGKS